MGETTGLCRLEQVTHSLSLLMTLGTSLVSARDKGEMAAEEVERQRGLPQLWRPLLGSLICKELQWCLACGPKEGFAFYYQRLDKRDLGQSKHLERKNKGN